MSRNTTYSRLLRYKVLWPLSTTQENKRNDKHYSSRKVIPYNGQIIQNSRTTWMTFKQMGGLRLEPSV